MGYGWVGRHIIRSFHSAKGFRIWDCIKFPFYFLILCSFIALGFRFCVWREKTKSLSNFQKLLASFSVFSFCCLLYSSVSSSNTSLKFNEELSAFLTKVCWKILSSESRLDFSTNQLDNDN